jgi:hypothetical protein
MSLPLDLELYHGMLTSVYEHFFCLTYFTLLSFCLRLTGVRCWRHGYVLIEVYVIVIVIFHCHILLGIISSSNSAIGRYDLSPYFVMGLGYVKF